MKKTIVITACRQCPHHMFDYDNGDTKYYGKDVCWFGQEPDADKRPEILPDASIIPTDCPLP